MSFVSINPATGHRIAGYRAHNRAAAERVVAQAHAAHPGWRGLGLATRAKHLRALARELRQHRDPLAAPPTP